MRTQKLRYAQYPIAVPINSNPNPAPIITALLIQTALVLLCRHMPRHTPCMKHKPDKMTQMSLSPSKNRIKQETKALGRRHGEISLLPERFELFQRRSNFAKDLRHGTGLRKHAVREGTEHIPQCETGDARLQPFMLASPHR